MKSLLVTNQDAGLIAYSLKPTAIYLE